MLYVLELSGLLACETVRKSRRQGRCPLCKQMWRGRCGARTHTLTVLITVTVTHTHTLPWCDGFGDEVGFGRWRLQAASCELRAASRGDWVSGEAEAVSASASELAMHGLAVGGIPRAYSCRLGVQTLAASHSGQRRCLCLCCGRREEKRREQHKEPLRGREGSRGCAEHMSSERVT
jgi:hypothetical protein